MEPLYYCAKCFAIFDPCNHDESQCDGCGEIINDGDLLSQDQLDAKRKELDRSWTALSLDVPADGEVGK